jgi:hypothetical protein
MRTDSLPSPTSLEMIDFRSFHVRRRLAEKLPALARARFGDGSAVPVELVEELADDSGVHTVGDLVLEIAIHLTEGHFADQVRIDSSGIDLAFPPGPQPFTGSLLPSLAIDLSRPDWVVEVRLEFPRGASGAAAQGVIHLPVPLNLDLRDWLSQAETKALLHGWYVRYQVGGDLCPGIVRSEAPS